MYDNTGEGWLKHMLSGTKTIMQLRGPAAHLTGSGRSFFLVVRIFEICRALIYNDSTFLAEPEWIDLMGKMWLKDCTGWHPMEALLDLMISCTSLSVR